MLVVETGCMKGIEDKAEDFCIHEVNLDPYSGQLYQALEDLLSYICTHHLSSHWLKAYS